jgi:hypothetical protein
MDVSDFSLTELDKEKILVCYDDDDHTFEHIKLPTRNLIHVDLDVEPGKDTTEFIKNTLFIINKRTPFNEAIVRLEILLLSNDLEIVDRIKITDYLTRELKAHHVCKITETRAPLRIIPETVKLFKASYDSRTSIKLYIDHQEYDSDDDKSMFEKIVYECYEEVVKK